jgi:SAM-dependent methyltransferase
MSEVIFRNYGFCYACNQPTQFTAHDPWLRDYYTCDNCGSIPRERALMYCLEKFFPGWQNLTIHESSPSMRGPSIRLKNEAEKYIPTQYFPSVKCGEVHKGFRCENLEKMTFEDSSIDLHITQDVFEHIFNPDFAFKEISRTLRPGGAHIFTIPLVNKTAPTTRLAVLDNDGNIHHLTTTPEYHINSILAEGSLVTVHWGYDISRYIFESSKLFTDTYIIDNLELGIRAEFIEVLISRKPVTEFSVSQ